ncbi:MAG TPA: hypothetical protein PLH27_12700 [bacterium]|nr:hypothetical protein [bacterium]HMW36591.1 hypothetical protein [bacterium]HMY35694.1 hypothetical protein [bacterium]HMZ04689.1 hypothetical protein [bacterium]HNB11074.1 hypothetical protein [bacterium]
MELAKYILPVFASAFLCAFWIIVQMIARRMKTKNLFDHKPSCGHCDEDGSCGGDHCEARETLRKKMPWAGSAAPTK